MYQCEKSLIFVFLQNTGMVTDLAVEVTRLNLEGTGTVEVLGGNHTREALQALHRKDMLSCSTVRVDLYKPLPRILALRLGYAHNTVLHEKNKPLSFIDKVRLMRDCRPAHQMAQKETKEWQDSLATVFGVKVCNLYRSSNTETGTHG